MPPSDSSRGHGSFFASVESVAWRWVLLDLVVVALWVALVSLWFRSTDLAPWVYYVAVFGSVAVYSLAGGSRTIYGRFGGGPHLAGRRT